MVNTAISTAGMLNLKNDRAIRSRADAVETFKFTDKAKKLNALLSRNITDSEMVSGGIVGDSLIFMYLTNAKTFEL